MVRKRGKRFPLLVYAHFWRRWGCLGTLLMVGSAALWFLTPRFSIPPLMRYLTLFPILVGGFLLLYARAARNLAHVRCFRTYMRVQGPIYPMFISYRRIRGSRPMQMSKIFDPEQDKAARRTWPLKYWAMTALVVDLKDLPLPGWWLRLWFDRHLFHPRETGMVLLVDDWMGLSQQLDSFMSAYRSSRA